VAFHPNGRQLAVGGDGGIHASLAIWDARASTPELDQQDEARSRVAFLAVESLPLDRVRAAAARDSAISSPVRERALALVDLLGRDQVRRQADDWVWDRYGEGLVPAEVQDRAGTDATLSEPVRREALDLASRWEGHPSSLNRASREVVRRPGAAKSAYERALRQAEAACRLAPYQGLYQTTLGMAQYRLGKLGDAWDTLIRADRLNATAETGSVPANLAFLAMTQFRLGVKDQACGSLDRLRKALRRPAWAHDKEARALLGEAERLIQGKPAPGSRTVSAGE
jgi:hypothetical protein